MIKLRVTRVGSVGNARMESSSQSRCSIQCDRRQSPPPHTCTQGGCPLLSLPRLDSCEAYGAKTADGELNHHPARLAPLAPSVECSQGFFLVSQVVENRPNGTNETDIQGMHATRRGARIPTSFSLLRSFECALLFLSITMIDV